MGSQVEVSLAMNWLMYLLGNLVLYLMQNIQRKQQTWIYFFHD